ncbi:hypothetical protein [Olleya sp. R77988]|uniref:hypothetical protein n=1 Tax=Olleya sp. R77988 TaxID=3093875 RepID=UPI0037C882F7
MKKLLFALLFLMLGVNLHAQETEVEVTEGTETAESDDKVKRVMELMRKEIDMIVDEDVFKSVGNNTYVSEEPKAVLLAMYIPESYEVSRTKMNNPPEDGFVVSDTGEKEVNGVKVLFMEGTSNTQGVTMTNAIYCMEIDENTCMMVMGMLEENADQKYIDIINRSINSVIKK